MVTSDYSCLKNFVTIVQVPLLCLLKNNLIPDKISGELGSILNNLVREKRNDLSYWGNLAYRPWRISQVNQQIVTFKIKVHYILWMQIFHSKSCIHGNYESLPAIKVSAKWNKKNSGYREWNSQINESQYIKLYSLHITKINLISTFVCPRL